MERQPQTPDFIVPHCEKDPEILFADKHILVVNKPSGLLSVPGRHPANRDSLITRVQKAWPTALIVHRLDMDTSGLMVLALDKPGHAELSRQFHDREVSKSYSATVAGHMSREQGAIEFPLVTDWPNRPLQKICYRDGKKATTRYLALEQLSNPIATRVTLLPITGRSHQLRVHLMALGHPILGDDFYGDPASRALSDRLALHASELSFNHPVSGKRQTHLSDPPFWASTGR